MSAGGDRRIFLSWSRPIYVCALLRTARDAAEFRGPVESGGPCGSFFGCLSPEALQTLPLSTQQASAVRGGGERSRGFVSTGGNFPLRQKLGSCTELRRTLAAAKSFGFEISLNVCGRLSTRRSRCCMAVCYEPVACNRLVHEKHMSGDSTLTLGAGECIQSRGFLCICCLHRPNYCHLIHHTRLGACFWTHSYCCCCAAVYC